MFRIILFQLYFLMSKFKLNHFIYLNTKAYFCTKSYLYFFANIIGLITLKMKLNTKMLYIPQEMLFEWIKLTYINPLYILNHIHYIEFDHIYRRYNSTIRKQVESHKILFYIYILFKNLYWLKMYTSWEQPARKCTYIIGR